MTGEYIVGVTGASGSTVAVNLLQALLRQDATRKVHLILSAAALPVLAQEMNLPVGEVSAAYLVARFLDGDPRVATYTNDQIAAPIASGSYPVNGMVVVPCSMNTLAAVATGLAPNLLTRAADVTLKERRPLLLAVRETPLHATHIENMLRVTRTGATVFPICPAYYAQPETAGDIHDNFVMRLLDHLGVPADRGQRWGAPSPGD